MTECDSCVHLLVDDVELLERNLSSMVRRLDNINVGVLALRRLHHINITATSDLRPLVNVLTATDPTQLEPIKQQLATVQTLADDVSVRVCYITDTMRTRRARCVQSNVFGTPCSYM